MKFFKNSIGINLFTALIFILLFGGVGAYQGIDLNWDLMNYHFYNGFSLFKNRMSFDIAPAQVQTYINPIFDIIIYLLLDSFKNIYWPITFILGSIHGVAGFILFKISILFLKDQKNWCINLVISLLIGLSGAAGFTLIGSTMNCWESSILVLGSLYCLLRYDDKRWLIFSGFLLGIAVGGKLTNAIYMIGMLSAMPFLYQDSRRRCINISLVFLGAITGIVVSAGFWFIILYNQFDSPLFPFFNNLIQSPWAEFYSFNDQRFLPKGIIQHLFYPFFWIIPNSGQVTELIFRDFRFALIYVLFLIYAFSKCIGWSKSSITPAQRFFYIFFLVSFIVWEIKFSIYRYLLPLENLTGIIIVLLIYSSLENWKETYKKLTLIVLCIFLLTTTIYPNWGRYSYQSLGIGYFRLSALPALPKNSIVLLAGGDAMSFLIPYFDPSIRFISIKNNFFDVTDDNKMADEIKKLIKLHDGDFYSFTMSYHGLNLKKFTDYLNLNEVRNSCETLEYAIADKITLCRLQRDLVK